MVINSLLVLPSLLLLFTSLPATPEDLLEGKGLDELPRLSMLYEVTLFNLDVASVDVFLPSQTARNLAGIARIRTSDSEIEIEKQLLECESAVIRLTFLRNGSSDQFLRRTEKNLRGAVRANLITPDEFESLWHTVVDEFSSLEDRGFRTGDTLYYSVEGDRVRVTYLDPEDQILFGFEQIGRDKARGVKGSFFSSYSEFSRGLIRSALGN